ncbi:MAG: hypothetical protein FJ125_12265 [Deltaproteobacteria bacterium]|nr:hypothetical protein [Deltaproteobacteria bacterium]
MTREQLEHVIRAAADIADDEEIVVVGSQAILGQFPSAPAPMLVSVEADVYPRNKPERSDLIDGCIGESSPFHDTYGYYAQGVGPGTAVLPQGWESRLVAICNPNTRGATGWCLEVHDLLLAKSVAGRVKDARFLRCAAEHGLACEETLLARLGTLPVSEELRLVIRTRIRAAFRPEG